jgi:hypothetical protein
VLDALKDWEISVAKAMECLELWLDGDDFRVDERRTWEDR